MSATAAKVAEKLQRLHARAVERRAAGLCPSCGAEPEEGKVLCPRHLAYHRQRRHEVYVARKAAGQCIQCGAPATRGIMCEKHRQTHRRAISKFRGQPRLPGECRQCHAPNPRGKILCVDCTDDYVADGAERRADRRARGLCACGRRRYSDYSLCKRCRAKRRQATASRRAKRLELGICENCPQPALDGTLRCGACTEKQAARTARWYRRKVALRRAGVSL